MSSPSVLPNYSLIPSHMRPEIIKNKGDSSQQITASLLIDVNRIFTTNLSESGPVIAGPQEDPPARGKVSRYIYNYRWDDKIFPGSTLMRSEGQAAIENPDTNAAYDNLGVTYDFFWNKFKRHSLDNNGLKLNAGINYMESDNSDNSKIHCGYKSTFWHSKAKCVMFAHAYSARTANRLTSLIDIVARGLTYGVTESEANFIYYGQCGALKESMSDVFGSMVKQCHKNQTAQQADWMIGEGMFYDTKGLRSLAAPGTGCSSDIEGPDKQVAHMKDYVYTLYDNGGVHMNSGIPNKAFYLTATKLGGYSWEKAGKIWYEALCDKSLKKENKGRNYGKVGFLEFSRLTIDKARSLFDQDTAEKVRDAWAQVGVR